MRWLDASSQYKIVEIAFPRGLRMLPIPADIFTEPDDVSNTLQRIGAPVLNPLAAILKDRADKASERP